jgi:hypothetical protein
MLSPHRFPADTRRLGEMIGAWKALRSEKVLEGVNAKHLAQLGLKEPCLVVQLDFPREKPVELQVGCPEGKSFHAIRVGDSRDVHVAKVDLARLGVGSPADYLSRRAFPIDAGSVSTIEITKPDNTTVHLARVGEESWSLRGSWGSLPASSKKAWKLLKALEAWRGESLEGHGTGAAQKKPTGKTWRVKISSAPTARPVAAGSRPGSSNPSPSNPGNSVDVLVGRGCESDPKKLLIVRAQPDPTRICAGEKLLEVLTTSPLDYLDRSALRVDPATLVSIAWARKDGRSFKLENRLGTWYLVGDEPTQRCANLAVSELLSKLSKVEAEGLVPVAKVASGDGQIRGRVGCLEMKTSSSDEIFSLCLFHPSANRWLLRRGAEPIALQVDGDIEEIFATRPSDLRSRVILSAKLKELPTLYLEKQSVTEKLIKSDNSMLLYSPVVGPPDSLALSRLRTLFSRLNVARFVSSQEAKQYLAKPDVVIRAEADSVPLPSSSTKSFRRFVLDLLAALRTAALEMRLEIGGDAPGGGCYGRKNSLTFILPKKACETLRAPLANRRVFVKLVSHQLASIEACTQKGCLELEKTGGVWALPSKGKGPPKKPTASQSTIRTAVSALVGLRAVKVLSYDPSPALRRSRRRICLTMKGKDAVRGGGEHADADTLLRHCVRIGDEEESLSGQKINRLMVEKRSVVYGVPASVVRRVLRPFEKPEQPASPRRGQ